MAQAAMKAGHGPNSVSARPPAAGPSMPASRAEHLALGDLASRWLVVAEREK